jgi:hypothetical protein
MIKRFRFALAERKNKRQNVRQSRAKREIGARTK